VAVTTAEWWSIDDVPLNQHGWNIRTVGGSRYGVPPMRGSDLQYAYVPGQEFRPKLPQSRTITLDMWVTGVDPDTGDTVADSMLRWNDSWQFLRHLFWQPGRQFVLTRRWLLTSPGGPGVQTASALGQLASNLDLAMTGRFRAEYTVDILLADPFFYGAEQLTQINVGQSATIVNPGDYTAAHRHFTVQFVGPLNTPTLVNLTTNPKVTLTLNAAIAAGETVTLDMAAFSALSDSGGNRIAAVIHSGARQWMGLVRGTNTLRLTTLSGTGHAVVRFQPPYV
jgi:hypothetical protein